MIIHEKYMQKLEEKEDHIALKNIVDLTSKQLTFLVPNEYFNNDIIKIDLKNYKPIEIVKSILKEMLDDAFNVMAFICLFKIKIPMIKDNRYVFVEINENNLYDDNLLPEYSHFVGIITPR